MDMPTPSHVEEAARIIDPVFRDTPCFADPGLDDRLGCRLLAKDETATPIGSFKGRGADYWMGAANPGNAPVVCASAGNFGQGVAYAARARKVPVTVFAAKTANPLKVEAMRRLGAAVKVAGDDFDAAKDAARSYAGERGLEYLEDGAHPAIAEGAGTIALELTTTGARFDAIAVPVGNGALIGGIGLWMKHRAPDTTVIGVTARNAPAMAQSWRTKRVVETPAADTIADGIAVRKPVPYALAVMDRVVDDVIAVDDDAIRRAITLLYEISGLVVEPAGAAGIAAIIEHPHRFAGRRVATVLCGGNIAPDLAKELGLARQHG